MMRIPNILKDLLPAERLKPILDLANQDKIAAVLKEVAEQIGWKGNTPSEASSTKASGSKTVGAKDLQQVVRQAKWWFDSLSQRFQSAAFVPLHQGINGTGQIFSSRWIASPMSSDAITAMSMVHSGFCVSEGLSESLHTQLSAATGAQACLITTNVESAILLLSAWLAPKNLTEYLTSNAQSAQNAHRKGWAISRGDCVRLPSDCDVVVLLQSMNSLGVAEVGASNECSPEDFSQAIAQGASGILRVVSTSAATPNSLNAAPSGSTSPEFHDPVLAADFRVPKVALALTAMLKDFPNPTNTIDTSTPPIDVAHDLGHQVFPTQIPSIPSILKAGADIVICPGNGWIGGPNSGIILGDANMIQSLKKIGQTLGLLASIGTLAGLRSAVENSSQWSSWQDSPIGQIATNSVKNLEHRAKKILVQLEGIPTINSARMELKNLPVGPSLWKPIQLESYCILVRSNKKSAVEWQAQLSKRPVPIESLVIDSELALVLRTINPADDQDIVVALAND